MNHHRRNLLLIVCTFALAASAHAEEGMWLLNHPPGDALKKAYQFTPTADWLEHVQKSCVRFGRGGSASLVSAEGLVMTNHHVGYGQLEKLSTKERNLLKEGFYANTPADELKCPDLEVSILWSIDDVTAQIEAVTGGLSAAEANAARQKKIAEFESSCKEETGLHCDVVTLYHGARFHVYRYRRYTDVRLVMAPEASIASFGGDVDNFEYPRFCLDVTFFRIYENDEPLKSEHYLKWSAGGVSENDLVFVTGHPGRTQRQLTAAHLAFLRDVQHPTVLSMLWRREVQLLNFSDRNDEFARIAQGDLKGMQNSRKAYTGMLSGLHDPDIFRAKVAEEATIKKLISTNPERQEKWGGAWNDVAASIRSYESFFRRFGALEGRGAGGGSQLLGIAQRLVRLAAEKPKPDGDRLRGYHDAELDSLYLRLFSPAPIYDDLEINRLGSWFSHLAETFGGDDPLVTKVLAGKSPRARAVELVQGTKLKDVGVRKKLDEGGMEAITSSGDPMIRFAYDIDSEGRALIKRHEDNVEGPQTEAYAKIAAARFAIEGENTYPDATGSLRLTYGSVKGFEEDGRAVPAFTTVAGLFSRHEARGGVEPFDLPKRWLEVREKLDPTTPFNFVCTTDVIGGNSGSPVINRAGEVVGLVFDINLPALVWDTVYTDAGARTVAVDARAMVESLRKVYGADRLVKEISSP
jgi:hypothetical protein